MVQPCNNSELRIVILVDNRVTDGLLPEHGFSLWIDLGDEHLLFDTGQGPALASNAPRLNIDCALADHLVLSHGHYDHTGGLQHVLNQAPGINVYCHPGTVQPRYSIRSGRLRPIKMPSDSGIALDHLSERQLHWVLQPVMINERIGLTGPIPRVNAWEDTGGAFYLDPEGRRSDPLEDDLALWIRTEKGLVVFLGCCHAGLINALHHILDLNPGERIHAVVGGFHLLNADDERIRRTISALRKLAPDKVIACHCTGDHAVAMLHDNLEAQVYQGAAGQTYCL